MINAKTFLAVIPARGGSKRLPRKNILDLAGQPLIGWTIEAAKNSKYIDNFVVSTDDSEIAEVSKKLGADVLIRPSELGTDTASSVDVVLHVIHQQDNNYDFVILLQPTSPMRSSRHIDEAIELLLEKNANAIISVCEADHSPLWVNTLAADGSMDCFIPDEVKGKRSQDLPTYYRLNGAIYIVDIEMLKKQKSIFLSSGTFSYEMEKESSVDIDNFYDFKLAKVLIDEVRNK